VLKSLIQFLLITFFLLSTSNLVFAKNKKSPDVRSAMAMVVHQNSDKVIYQKKAYTKLP
jgi:D-alanyl-D-alanine carboxypeptidase